MGAEPRSHGAEAPATDHTSEAGSRRRESQLRGRAVDCAQNFGGCRIDRYHFAGSDVEIGSHCLQRVYACEFSRRQLLKHKSELLQVARVGAQDHAFACDNLFIALLTIPCGRVVSGVTTARAQDHLSTESGQYETRWTGGLS